MEPEDQNIPMQQASPMGEGRPYFMGDHALIRFSSGEEGFGKETYWLLDKNDHTIRPFESPMALDAVFGDDLKTALENVAIVSQPMVDEQGDINDGVLQDFTLLSPEYVIKEDGSAKPLDFSNHQLRSRYGKEIDESAEQLASDVAEGFLDLLKKNEDKTNIPASFIQSIKRNPKIMAFYVSALAYGDYTMSDILGDIQHRFNNK